MNLLEEDLFLDTFLAPLAPYLSRSDVTDVWCNRPGELWVETLGAGIEHHSAPQLTRQVLTRLARQIAARSAQGVNRAAPLLAASLPDGSRVQVVLPPATRGEIALAIRRHVSAGLPLGDWKVLGTAQRAGAGHEALHEPDVADVHAYLRWAVLARRNILVCGGTSSGKTTLLNSLIAEIPERERLIFIEDTPELQFGHPNAVGMIAVRGAMGEATVTAEDLLIAALRMRPDRIILGEIRGAEAFTFLRAINTGHPGSLSTIHANSAELAIDQLVLLVMQAGSQLTAPQIEQYVRQTVDVVVEVGNVQGSRGIAGIAVRVP